MSNSDWYARKLGNPSPSRHYSQPATPPVRPQPQYQQPQPQQTPDTKVTMDNLVEATGQWQGGQGTQTERDQCPNCNSHLYFSRANGTGEGGGSGAKVFTQNGVATVAPRCFACGFSPSMPMQGGAG